MDTVSTLGADGLPTVRPPTSDLPPINQHLSKGYGYGGSGRPPATATTQVSQAHSMGRSTAGGEMKLKGPYGETLKAYQPNSKNSWSQMFPLSPYTPKPPKQQPAKYVPTTNLKSELSRSADQLRQYLGPPPTTATSSVIRIGQSKVPTRSFATQTTIKNKKHAAAVQTPTDWIENMERLIEFFLESIQETEEAKRQLLLHEEEQALSDVTEDHVQFLMSQASSPRSQELSPTKPKNNGVRNLILMLNAGKLGPVAVAVVVAVAVAVAPSCRRRSDPNGRLHLSACICSAVKYAETVYHNVPQCTWYWIHAVVQT